jgi:hypothetical protein
MRLPAATASYRQSVRFGRYLARRLRRAKYASFADDVAAATTAVRDAGRTWEDADDVIQDALADRDAADDALDATAKEARANLAGRSADAVKKPPFTQIFERGLGYYTAAPLAEETKRYGELEKRLAEHLPANDDVRKKSCKAIVAGCADFEAASKEVDDARTAESLAATKLAAAIDAWNMLMEKTYGALVAELGRAGAESFFPKTRGKAADGANGDVPAEPKPA